jgi:hypothetical protein
MRLTTPYARESLFSHFSHIDRNLRNSFLPCLLHLSDHNNPKTEGFHQEFIKLCKYYSFSLYFDHYFTPNPTYVATSGSLGYIVCYNNAIITTQEPPQSDQNSLSYSTYKIYAKATAISSQLLCSKSLLHL